MRRALFFVCIAYFSLACTSTKIVFDESWNPKSKAAYEDYFDSYLLGFSGQPQVYLQKVCMDQKPLAVQRLRSPEDLFFSVVTLGVYWPVTVRVWCGG